MGRLLVFGDIHGHFDKLQEVYEKAKVTAEDRLIFLGDYIDRGEENIRSFLFVKRLAESGQAVMLPGNHELMMVEHFLEAQKEAPASSLTSLLRRFTGLLKKRPSSLWLQNGGNKTLRELLQREPEEQREILDWALHLIRENPTYSCEVDGRTVHFAHAGMNPAKPLAENTLSDYLWIRDEFYENYTGEDLWVVGHTPVQILTKKVQPLLLPNHILMMDTGSYLPDGKISCADLTNMRFYSSDV